jgi:hypothetical protein
MIDQEWRKDGDVTMYARAVVKAIHFRKLMLDNGQQVQVDAPFLQVRRC